jgi:hypothetical protein
MNGPKDCGVKRDFEFGFIPFSEMNHTARFVLGRIQSNGKDDNYLRIKTRNDDQNVVKEFMFDYLELCPAAICDNQEIPEE